MSLVDPIVTWGYGPESGNIPTWGYNGSIDVVVPVLDQGATPAPLTVLKRTITTVRINIEHVDPKIENFVTIAVGKFEPEVTQTLLNIEKIKDFAFDVVVRHVNIELASKLNRILTGSKDIKIETGENDKDLS